MLPNQLQVAIPGLPRMEGEVSLVVRAGDRGTTLRKLRHSGSLKCLFPRFIGTGLQAVVLNCAGGVAGGDHLLLNACAEAETTLTIATQAAERIYRARRGEKGSVETRLEVADGARLLWLPQETILFNGCSMERSITVDLQETATLLLSEPLVFGRIEMGEVLNSVDFKDRIEIRRAGFPIYLDLVHLSGDAQAQLDRPGVADGARAMASLVYVAPDAEMQCEVLRQMLPRHAGASMLHSDVLIMRLLARDSNDMRSSLVPILNHLSHDGLPRCWNI